MSNNSDTITYTEGKFHVHMKEPRWIIDNNGRCIASTDVNRPEDYPVGEQIANARLMACAGEMRALLEQVSDEYTMNDLDLLERISTVLEKSTSRSVHSSEAYEGMNE